MTDDVIALSGVTSFCGSMCSTWTGCIDCPGKKQKKKEITLATLKTQIAKLYISHLVHYVVLCYHNNALVRLKDFLGKSMNTFQGNPLIFDRSSRTLHQHHSQ